MEQIKRTSLPDFTGALPEKVEPTSWTSEARLVEAAKSDAAAFEILYARYVLRIYHYLCLRCPTPEDAADLTQHVFAQALHALPTYQERNLPFAAWLFRIARNAAIDVYRSRNRLVPLEFIPLQNELTDSFNPETEVLRQEKQKQLSSLVAQLSQNKRELLALRFAVGLSISEIAGLLGKSEATTRKQLARVIANLKQQYEEQYQ